MAYNVVSQTYDAPFLLFHKPFYTNIWIQELNLTKITKHVIFNKSQQRKYTHNITIYFEKTFLYTLENWKRINNFFVKIGESSFEIFSYKSRLNIGPKNREL